MFNVRNGTKKDEQTLLNKYPDLHKFFVGDGWLIVAESGQGIAGFLWAHRRKIPAPVDAEEMFINAVEVFDSELRCQGIGTQMVQRIIETAKSEQVYQVRASVQIGNVASHRLWRKNKFSISPVQMPDGNIAGSFVAYVL